MTSNAIMVAVSSIRLLVVSPASPPYSSRACSPYLSTAPQPPGPGLRVHPSSRALVTTSSPTRLSCPRASDIAAPVTPSVRRRRDKITRTASDWRTELVDHRRTLINEAEPDVVEEAKWR